MAGRDVRNNILPAACSILATQGLEALHARSVATVLGVNHATIHYYYKTRQDLMLGVLQHWASGHETLVLEKVVPARDGNAVASHLTLFRGYLEGEFFSVFGALHSFAAGDPEFADLLSKSMAGIVSQLRTSIDRTRKADVKVRKGPLRNPEILVATIFGLGLTKNLTESDMFAKFDAIVAELLD